MGYYIFSYGIKTEEIQKVFGSNDLELLDQVQSHKTFQYYADGESWSPRQYSMALSSISTYRPGDDLHHDIYCYAFVCICAALGTTVPYRQEIKLGADTDEIYEVLAADFGIKELDLQKLLVENGHPFPVPQTLTPSISLVKLEELTAIKSKLSSVQITDEKMKELANKGDIEYTYEHLRGFIQNINYCIDHGLDMVSFCH